MQSTVYSSEVVTIETNFLSRKIYILEVFILFGLAYQRVQLFLVMHENEL